MTTTFLCWRQGSYLLLQPAGNVVITHSFYLIAASLIIHGLNLQLVPSSPLNGFTLLQPVLLYMDLTFYPSQTTLSSIYGYSLSPHMHLGWKELLGLPEPQDVSDDDYLIAASQLYEAEQAEKGEKELDELLLAASQHYEESTSSHHVPSSSHFGASCDV